MRFTLQLFDAKGMATSSTPSQPSLVPDSLFAASTFEHLQLFDAKGMAGNIIHAIATTNAIISGLIVIEAIKILAGVCVCVCPSLA